MGVRCVGFSHKVHYRAGGSADFSQPEINILMDVVQILNSSSFNRMRAAYEHGRTTTVRINGVVIVYREDEEHLCGTGIMGYSFMNPPEFSILCDAWKSRSELIETVAHELHRIRTSTISRNGFIGAGDSTIETRNAVDFSKRVSRQLL